MCGPCSAVLAAEFETEPSFSRYELFAMSTSAWPNLGHPSVFPAIGLGEEAGEVLGKVKKTLRDGGGDFAKNREAILLELGDVLWYITATAEGLGATLADVAAANMRKLAGRRTRGTVRGSGDDR